MIGAARSHHICKVADASGLLPATDEQLFADDDCVRDDHCRLHSGAEQPFALAFNVHKLCPDSEILTQRVQDWRNKHDLSVCNDRRTVRWIHLDAHGATSESLRLMALDVRLGA